MPEHYEDAGAASLTGQLLARKGTAHPSSNLDTPWSARYTALGHAAGQAAAPPQPPAKGSEAPKQHLQRTGGGPLHIAWPTPEPERKVKLTVRLDSARHRRLRLAAVHKDQSLQAMLVAALDQYLEGLDVKCSCIRGVGPDKTACADCPSPEIGTETAERMP